MGVDEIGMLTSKRRRCGGLGTGGDGDDNRDFLQGYTFYIGLSEILIWYILWHITQYIYSFLNVSSDQWLHET
jgi:hypothetical protein